MKERLILESLRIRNEEDTFDIAEYGDIKTPESAPADVPVVNEYLQGKASKMGFKAESAPPEELAMGIEVEYEHTGDKAVATTIALDHIAESGGPKSKYYTYLKEMEDRIKSELGETI